MLQTEISIPGPFKNKYFLFAVIVALSILLAALVGLLSTLNPFIALGVVLFFSASVIVALLRLPNLIVVFVTFLIYTNTAVVLINFHNVPSEVGYALPLLLLFPFLWQVIVKKQKVKFDFLFILMLVFLAINLLGAAFSRDVSLAFPNVVNYLAEGLGLYFLLINTIRTPDLLKKVVWALLVGGAIIGALALYQQVTNTFDNNYWGYAQVTGQGFTTAQTLQGSTVQARVSGPIGEKNRFAQVMLLMVPVGLFLAWGEPSRKLRLLAFLMTGLIFIGGSLAFSRGAQVGVLLLIVIMAFMRYIKIQQLLIVFLGIVLLLLAFPQNIVRFSSLGAIFSSQDQGGIRSADGAIQGRATEMLAAMLVFIDHPIIGVGPGMFSYEMAQYAKIVSLRYITTTREAHSLYLGVAAETGIFGFLTLMSILAYTLYRLAKARKYWLGINNVRLANLCTGFFLSIVSYMTTGFFLHFAYIRYFWMFIALSIIVSEFREKDFPATGETAEAS